MIANVACREALNGSSRKQYTSPPAPHSIVLSIRRKRNLNFGNSSRRSRQRRGTPHRQASSSFSQDIFRNTPASPLKSTLIGAGRVQSIPRICLPCSASGRQFAHLASPALLPVECAVTTASTDLSPVAWFPLETRTAKSMAGTAAAKTSRSTRERSNGSGLEPKNFARLLTPSPK